MAHFRAIFACVNFLWPETVFKAALSSYYRACVSDGLFPVLTFLCEA
jgi:hypothetical protein